jgi:GNAT superfamily N-acetyltransferase
VLSLAGEYVGRALMIAAEDRAVTLGCEAIELTSGLHESHEAAHRFYDALGYLCTAQHLWKPLSDGASRSEGSAPV